MMTKKLEKLAKELEQGKDKKVSKKQALKAAEGNAAGLADLRIRVPLFGKTEGMKEFGAKYEKLIKKMEAMREIDQKEASKTLVELLTLLLESEYAKAANNQLQFQVVAARGLIEGGIGDFKERFKDALGE